MGDHLIIKQCVAVDKVTRVQIYDKYSTMNLWFSEVTKSVTIGFGIFIDIKGQLRVSYFSLDFPS